VCQQSLEMAQEVKMNFLSDGHKFTLYMKRIANNLLVLQMVFYCYVLDNDIP